jgi:malonyl-CoA O-methyltransferase
MSMRTTMRTALRQAFRRLLRPLREAAPATIAVEEAYARLADSYPAEAHNPFMRLEQATVLALLPDVAGKTALDVACGTGRYLEILRARGAALAVGVDASSEMLKKARGPRAIARGDLRALPVATARFDLVVCGLAVGHVAALAVVLAEMGRVLRPGGTLVYSDFHPFARLQGHARVFSVGGRAFAVEHHVHLYAAHQAACRAAGLEIEEVREAMSSTEPPFPAVLAIRARRR